MWALGSTSVVRPYKDVLLDLANPIHIGLVFSFISTHLIWVQVSFLGLQVKWAKYKGPNNRSKPIYFAIELGSALTFKAMTWIQA